MKIISIKNKIKALADDSLFLSGVFVVFCLSLLSLTTNILTAQAAEIAQYNGGILVYADNTTGVPKYKVFNDSTGFGSEQSATAVGGAAIEWVRLATNPLKNEWIIVTRDSADVLVAQVCNGVDEGLSCGATTTITATAGTHGLRNFDVAYEQLTGDALLVYGTATADELRKIEYTGGAWVSDAAITTTRTTGTVEWVELTSRNASDQIGIAYSDSNDDVSAYRWSGTAAGNEATAVITATAATTDVRKFDISFEGLSGDMIVASPLATAGTTALGHMTAAGTWTIVANTEPDNITAFIDLQEPNPIDDDVAMIAHGTATTSNPAEGYELNGATPNTTTTGMVDGTVAVDTTTTVWAANYMMSSVAYQSSTYYAVGIFSDVTGADDVNWWTMASTGVWTVRTDNVRTRGTIRFTDIFDYPNADKVLLLSSDANSDLWADSWNGATTSATAWNDITSGSALETSLSSATTDVYDFAFRISPPAISGVLYTNTGGANAGAGKTVNIRVGTSTPNTLSTVTTAGGVWEFPDRVFTNATSGTPFVIWLDGEVEDATTVVSGYSGVPISNVPLIYHHVTSHGVSDTTVINESNFVYDSGDDADILFEYTGIGYVTINSAFIINKGILSAPNLFTVGGDFANRGTFNANGGTVVLYASGAIFDGVLTGTSSFHILEISEGSSMTFATSSASTTDLRINAGAVFTSPANLTIAGNFVNEGTFNSNLGTIYLGLSGVELGGFVTGLNVNGATNNDFGYYGNVRDMIVIGQYLYTGGTSGYGSNCSQTAGSAHECELQIYNVSNPAAPSFVYSLDADGSAAGTSGNLGITAFSLKGNTLYVAKEGAAEACGQTAGNGRGCELMVFDVSSSTKPVYLAGRDASGSLTGTASVGIRSMEIAGNYLYIAKAGNGTACSQTIGSAEGCELMVFDISSSTNPVYVAGRDHDASLAGTVNNEGFYDLLVHDTYLYVGKNGGGTCVLAVGSAAECQLHIYDIASGANPVLVGSLVSDATQEGTSYGPAYSLATVGNTLYLGRESGGGPCSQTTGSAAGACELQIYDISSSTNPVYVAGRDALGSADGAAEVGNTIIDLAVTDRYLYVVKQDPAHDCYPVPGVAAGCTLQIYDISSTTNPVFLKGDDGAGSYEANKTSFVTNFSVFANQGYVYVGRGAGDCNNVAGSADGCALLVLDGRGSSVVYGDFTNTNSLHDLQLVGTTVLASPASTSDITMRGAFFSPQENTLTIAGDFNKISGETYFSHDAAVYLSSSSPQTVSGTFTGRSALPRVIFAGTGTKTIEGIASSTSISNQSGSVAVLELASDIQNSISNNGALTTQGPLRLGGNYLNAGTTSIEAATTIDGALQFIGGVDASGQATGTAQTPINDFLKVGEYLYAAGRTDGGCTTSPLDGSGCALRIFDVSSSTNPLYINGLSYSDTGYFSLAARGNYLYVANNQYGGIACNNSNRFACEIQVFDISSTTNPIYVTGRDVDGSEGGTEGREVESITVSGNYLYIGKYGDATACSQVVGSAEGCELMVFDISSSTNPVYVAGRDVSGSNAGTADNGITTLVASGTYLYVGLVGNNTTCSQVAGSAEGCELQVYDISNPTNLVYRAGRDSDTTGTGTEGNSTQDLKIVDTWLYVGKGQYYSDCPATLASCHLQVFNIASATNPVFVNGASGMGPAGIGSGIRSARIVPYGDKLYMTKDYTVGGMCDITSTSLRAVEGCELVVFDISSSSKPVYETARDVSGSDKSGTVLNFQALAAYGDYLYVGGNDFGFYACVPVVGSAEGCDVQVYRLAPAVAGSLTGNNAFTDLTVKGAGAIFLDNVETDNFTIARGEVVAPEGTLTINGNYNNQSVFDANSGTVDLAGSGAVNGNLTTEGTFNNLVVSGNYTVAVAQASTTNLVVESTGDFTAPDDLTVYGNFNNQGVFDSNNGTLYVENNGAEALTYIAGRDVSGSASGTGSGGTNALASSGKYLFVAGEGSATACSQAAGSAIGCELQVYDISSSTNPVYVAGRDTSGSAAGTGNVRINSLAVKDSYLYVGKGGNATACSQTAGSAIGCELMVFDIANPINPTFVAGRDHDTSATGANGASFTNVKTLAVDGSYLYLGSNYAGGSTPCAQTAPNALNCELQVYDISSSTNPIYVAGRDQNGSPSGTGVGEGGYNHFFINDDYLYATKYGQGGACSQTASTTGSAGCELQVYDISSSTNPIYVAGRDTSGSADGAVVDHLRAMVVSGDYLYVGGSSDSMACAQSVGFAQGCDLKVFNIASSTNPIFVTGRDVSGSVDGLGIAVIDSLIVKDNLLLVGIWNSGGACVTIAGSAEGCEVQVYDISNLENPTFLTGKDSSGSNIGTSTSYVYALLLEENNLYVGTRNFSATACSQLPGLATGCDLVVFDTDDIRGYINGSFAGASALSDVYFIGRQNVSGSASTSDLFVTGTTTFASNLTVRGDYSNSGVISYVSAEQIISFDSNSAQSIAGSLTASSTLPQVVFAGSGIKTLGSIATTSNLTILGGEVSTNNSLEINGLLINQGSLDGETVFLNGSLSNVGTFGPDTALTIDAYVGRYLGGLDSSGGIGGTSTVQVQAVAVRGNYVYVGKSNNATACSQTAGQAIGCELMVFDMSSSTNLIYVAGRDVDGSSSGTGNLSVANLVTAGNYLYVGTAGNVTACSQTAGSATGCEIQVYDISSSTNPVYVAGRDSSGSAAGTGGVATQSLVTAGSHLYISKTADNAACSQAAGSANGCEIMVFDISTPTNPVYLAGRDSSGSAAGTAFNSIFSLTIQGNYLFAANDRNGTACSQTAGSAIGCEIQVYDISTPTSPTYRAGRDASGSATGSWQFTYPVDVVVNGDYLYVSVVDLFQSTCVNTAGSANGCDLQIYNISSSTNPVYAGGRDVVGVQTFDILIENNYLYLANAGSPGKCAFGAFCEMLIFDISSSTLPVYVEGIELTSTVNSLTVSSNKIIAGLSGSDTVCNQATNAVAGCEIKILELAPSLSGSLTATSSLGNLTIKGAGAIFNNNASTTNLVIEGGVVTAPAVLSVDESFENNATFDGNGGEVVLLGNEHTISGTTTFFNLTKNATGVATTTFEAGSLTTINGTWNFTGNTEGSHLLRSSADGEDWYVTASNTTLTNLDVKDSNNVNVSSVVCDPGCIDSMNNTNWLFEPLNLLTFTSLAPHQFYVGQATTTLPAFTIIEGSSATITAVNDILLHIDTTNTNFRFDQATDVLSFGGTAANKVSDTVFFEEGGISMRIDVGTDFDPLDTLIINGVAVGSFATVTASTSYFTIHTDDTTAGTPAATDLQGIRITGSLLLSDHAEGQVDNEFGSQNKNDVPLFAFNLEANGENTTLTDLVLTLSGVQGLDASKISDFNLYRDNNSDLMLDGGDTLIDGNGVLTIAGQYGAVTFSSDFTATSTSRNYLITADTNNIRLNDSVRLTLAPLGITGTGAISLFSPVIISTLDTVQHFRNGGGGGGVSAAIGGGAPEGAGNQTGGETGGGAGAGEQEDGENIARDPNFARPTETGAQNNEWTNGTNALLSDGTYATAASGGLDQSFSGFAFNVPGGNTIEGIAVKLDASGSTAAGTINVALSWDAGASYTTMIGSPTLSGSDIVYTLGGNTDLWGRTWTPAEVSQSNFRLRVSAQPSANTIRLDALEVRIYHKAGGGSAGGGGGI